MTFRMFKRAVYRGIKRNKRLRVYRMDSYQCVYCGANLKQVEAIDRTIDHLCPVLDLFGLPCSVVNSIGNLVTACYACNTKYGRTPTEQKCPQYGRFGKRELSHSL